MSGQKCAQVDLSAAAQEELNRILEQSRRHAHTLAGLSNLAGRLRSLQDEAERYLTMPTISSGFRKRLEEFCRVAAQFNVQFDEVRRLLDEVERLGQSPSNPIVARNEASRLQGEITRLVNGLSGLTAEVEEQLKAVEQGIAAERQTEDYRAGQADRRLRQELSGLLEELKMRLRPSTSLNLLGVAPQAGALMQNVERLLKRDDRVTEEEVRDCRRQLDALGEEVERREQERQKQWAIFSRLNDAFQGAGFQLDMPVKMPQQHDLPIKARHVINEEELRASVKTMVYRGGAVSLEMWGASGEDTAALGKDQHCDLNLERIVRQALSCGLVIKSVTVKDPDSPDGWTAMVVPGVGASMTETEEDETQEPVAKKVEHQQQMMMKDRK